MTESKGISPLKIGALSVTSILLIGLIIFLIMQHFNIGFMNSNEDNEDDDEDDEDVIVNPLSREDTTYVDPQTGGVLIWHQGPELTQDMLNLLIGSARDGRTLSDLPDCSTVCLDNLGNLGNTNPLRENCTASCPQAGGSWPEVPCEVEEDNHFLDLDVYYCGQKNGAYRGDDRHDSLQVYGDTEWYHVGKRDGSGAWGKCQRICNPSTPSGD